MSESNTSEQSNSVGSAWEIKTKAERVAVTKPDGSVHTFAAFNGVALVVLETAGEWSAEVDGKPVTVKAS